MKKLVIIVIVGLCGCDDATTIVVDNAYADDTIVDEVWWSQTLVPDAVAPGGESPVYRTTPALETAYVVAERGGNVFVARTAIPLGVERSAELHVVISAANIVGDCGFSNARLTQPEADFITQSIFPGRFAGAVYDAATCKTFKP
jgi:hypothetical protein